MEQAIIIPVVRWIRNGYASELPVQLEIPDEPHVPTGKRDFMDLEDYDNEDSRDN